MSTIEEVEQVGADAVAELLDHDLEHHGVKGMKWGVRKDRHGRDRWSPKDHSVGADVAKAALLTVGGQPAQVRLAKRAAPHVVRGAKAVPSNLRDVRFRTKANSSSNINKLVGAAAKQTKANDLPKINEKYKGIAKTSKQVYVHGTSRVPAQKAYRKEVANAYRKNLDAVANAHTSPSGKRQYVIQERRLAKEGSPTQWKVKVKRIQHDALESDSLAHAEDAILAPDVDFVIELVEDDEGYITDFKHVDGDTELEQTATLGEEYLAHYGVLGMKWGQRKSRDERSTPTPVAPSARGVVREGTRKKTKIKTEGGENHDAHPDAIKVAESKAKLKKSGPAALSNAELREVANRMQLESQVKVMTSGQGQKFVSNLLKTQGQNEINSRINVNRQQRLRPQS